eukprot:scaffold11272_cov158-Amphora_coffeaeformis.AAC.2
MKEHSASHSLDTTDIRLSDAILVMSANSGTSCRLSFSECLSIILRCENTVVRAILLDRETTQSCLSLKCVFGEN